MNNDDPIDLYPSVIGNQYPMINPNPNVIYAPMSATIESLIITDSGSYNDQVIRPHVTTPNQDSLNMFVNNVQSAISRGSAITPVLLGSNLGNIVSPSTGAENSLEIPNGWSTPRLRFFLKVRITTGMSNPKVAYFQGYSEYSDLSLNGSIDPNMTFFINSFTVIEESNIMTPNGACVMPKVVESSNILPPSMNAGSPFTPKNIPSYNQITGESNIYNAVNPLVNYIRPNDIFSSIQVSHLSDTLGGATYDVRSNPNSFVKSWRSNSNTGSYMSRIINNYVANTRDIRARVDIGAYDDMSTVLEQSINSPEEDSLTDNAFFRMLSKANGASFKAVTHFSLNTLMQMDPDLPHKLRYVKPAGQLMSSLPRAGETEYWTGQTREVMAATMIVNSLSSILFDNMISKVSLVSTNLTVDGSILTTFSEALSLTGLDVSQYLPIITYRLEKEILSTISFNNQDFFKVILDMDLFGFTKISISLSNGPLVPFTTPTFADSLFSPVITSQPALKNNLVKDIEYALDAVTSSISRPLHPSTNTQYDF